MKKFLLSMLLSIPVIGTLTAQNCLDCGTGADLAYTASSNTTIVGGTYNFTSFTIDSGVTVTVTGSQPLVIYATGDVIINGTLDASGGNGADALTFSNAGIGGIGVAGGGDGGDGVFSSFLGPLDGISGQGTGNGSGGSGWSGGGGGGYASNGQSSGGVGGFGGISYGDIMLSSLFGGSGAGGGSGGYDCGGGGGGAGGGIIQIHTCTNITIGVSGQLLSNGGNGGSDDFGNCGGGGGGTGGSIWLAALLTLTNDGLISAEGGLGGASAVPGFPYYGDGGAGAEGRIRADYTTLAGTGTVTPAVGYTSVPSGLIVSVNVNDVSCNGAADGAIQLAVSGGSGNYTYAWTPNVSTGTSASNLSGGTYSVLIDDGNGCTASEDIVVNEAPALVINATVYDLDCFGDIGAVALQVSGGTPGYGYSWSPGGQTTDSIGGLTGGSYTVIITDNNGCDSTLAFQLAQPTQLVLNLTATDETFAGANDGSASATVTGGTTPYTYAWSNGQSSPSINNLIPGVYTVIITDANGCTITDSIEVKRFNNTGIDTETGITVEVFPNPVYNGQTWIKTTAFAGDATIKLFAVNGTQLWAKNITLTEGTATQIEVGQLAEGIYILQLDNGIHLLHHRLVVAK